jgi:hypothetical protein
MSRVLPSAIRDHIEHTTLESREPFPMSIGLFLLAVMFGLGFFAVQFL